MVLILDLLPAIKGSYWSFAAMSENGKLGFAHTYGNIIQVMSFEASKSEELKLNVCSSCINAGKFNHGLQLLAAPPGVAVATV